MNPLEEGLLAAVDVLESARAPYMVIGGIALAACGVPRATFDVDVTVWAPGAKEKALIRRLTTAFKARVKDAQDFVKETRVLPLQVKNARMDIVFGDLPYQKRALRRAKRVRVGKKMVRFCSPEDLILHKIISEREKDRWDVRELLKVRGRNLDRAYLDPLVRELSDSLSRPELWREYAASFNR